MNSNDSGVESSTDNDDFAQPTFRDTRDMKLVSSATNDLAVVPVRRLRNQEFSLSLCLNTITDPMVFARPVLDEIPGRKYKCLFELANPSYPSTLDRFQSVSIIIC